jgi:hypothetical protein
LSRVDDAGDAAARHLEFDVLEHVAAAVPAGHALEAEERCGLLGDRVDGLSH